MLELVRDPAWQFAGAFFALLSLAAAIGFYWLQRQTKELAFGRVSSRRLLSIADELSTRVSVQLDGKPIRDLHLLVYGLKNSGRVAVSQADFVRPLSISFPDGQVLSAEIAAERPVTLGATLTISDSRVELCPLLLNAGDTVQIQVLLSSALPSELIDVRVVDVPSMMPINVQPRSPPFLQSGLPWMIVSFMAVALIDLMISDSPLYATGFVIVAAFAALFGFVARFLETAGTSGRRRISES